MKLPCINVFRLRRRNTLILLAGIAASCLVFLSFRDNLVPHLPTKDYENRKPKRNDLPTDNILTTKNSLFTKKSLVTNAFPSDAAKAFRRISTPPVDNDHKEEANNSIISSAERNVQRHTFLHKNSRKPKWKKELYYNISSTPGEFLIWRQEKVSLCDNRMRGYGQEFLEMKDAVIEKKFCTCKLKGGELIENVINQDEMAEYYKFEMGCFQTACKRRPTYYFNGENHLTKWMYSLATQETSDDVDQENSDFTIAITRYEYANLFHTMTDWYNAFLVMQFYNRTSFDTNILIIDAHPFGALDSVWTQLFNSTVRLAGLPSRIRFRNLVWGILGYNSLMKIYVSPTPPLFEDFRDFFLSAFDINTTRELDCKRLSILFIWRHNYLAHPRNPSGFVSRKIHNEDQLIRYVKRRNSNSIVTGIQIDAYSMRQQLQFISDADILVGMHGAGLTHAVFLQKKSALIELVPNYWSPMAEHFKAICVWRGLIYKQWFNNDPRNEFPDQSTNIPPQVMNTLVKNTIREMCVH